MCNCGNKRSALTGNRAAASAPVQSAGKMNAGTHFEYTGSSALTVIGNITGRRYRFNNPGEQLLIDFRDVHAMMLVPVLKKV